MTNTTIGLKIDDSVRERLRLAADQLGHAPHWLAKQALLAALERVERGERPFIGAEEDDEGGVTPFLAFAQSVQPQSTLRARITAATRSPEPERIPQLLEEARLTPEQAVATHALALKLVGRLREKGARGPVQGLIAEYALSSQEGIALMCLAEALLRIPDKGTRDALIRDKIGGGDWQKHLGSSRSLFVNAATWGLLITGRLAVASSETGLTAALTRLIGRGGEPLIRRGVDTAIRIMGEQFVTGQTIAEALANARKLEAKGFRYSYDMLGEAAMNAADAARYMKDYEQAIAAVGAASAGRGPIEGPGVSVKLSAIHPRFARAQRERVMAELLPAIRHLCELARDQNIGLTIDAEECDRLELCFDLYEQLALDPALAHWEGLGFVVQAYQKRAPLMVEALIDLARRANHRLCVRLVKGAYWDLEIKRAQLDGVEDFPVWTRKAHTDLSYLACARRMLAATDIIFAQFATHNARTLAALMALAGPEYPPGRYEFQCLHGMGQPLYEEVVGPDKLNRPARFYAPVGSHETLLAYLVRRLLENGSNSSFVNQLGDESVSPEKLIADPVDIVAARHPLGAPHPRIAMPRDVYGTARPNSWGIDLADEQRLASLAPALLASAAAPYEARPMLGEGDTQGSARDVLNPADHRDRVGSVVEATPDVVEQALAQATEAAGLWQSTPPAERAACLRRAADILEERMPALMGLVVREAGKTLPNAVGEVREAVDFLRFYASQAEGFDNATHRPLGVVADISPWNFPLSIFLGQVSAALAAGNAVIAKPAEETPLIAAQAVAILREAGVPAGAVQLLPGDGGVGAALVADARVAGVGFTGSIAAARSIARSLAGRLDANGRPIPLVAETGGQNAMIVDSSALAEQVVADVLTSAFDSAGQRCSALRILCLQEEVAGHMLEMLRGAMAELAVGNPDRLSTDVGPIISAAQKEMLEAHIAAMRTAGRKVTAGRLPAACAHGTFVAPAIVEIDSLDELKGEVFGPVLHVIRWKRLGLDRLVEGINALGYGLTFGVHTRIEETVERVLGRIVAGNCYVNRNIIGATVGVQPFGGSALSGTGPKAGGPLTLCRLLAEAPEPDLAGGQAPAAAGAWADWLAAQGEADAALRVRAQAAASPLGLMRELKGVVGERNTWSLEPRGTVECRPATPLGLALQVGAALATGNRAAVVLSAPLAEALKGLPAALAGVVSASPASAPAAVLYEGDADGLRALAQELAAREGPLVALWGASSRAVAEGRPAWPLHWLLRERSVSVNTAAAGGNANLLTEVAQDG